MKKISITLLTIFAFLFANAQDATVAVGGDATGNGGSAAYSIGQVVYTSNSGTTGSVNQGVQQPYNIEANGIFETSLNISLTVFPNPTAANLTLIVANYNNEKLTYQLLDIQGKLITAKDVTSSKTEIHTSDLAYATYILNVTLDNKTVQSFKIIKN